MGTINDKLEYLDDTKLAIKVALQSKGIEVNDEDTFRSYAEMIENIDASGGNVMSEELILTPEKVDASLEDEIQYSDYKSPFIDSEGNEFEGASNIKVRKVGSWIDSEISSDNIRQGHTILGVAGNVIQLLPQPTITTKSGTSQKTLKPTGDYNSLSEVIVEPLVLQSKTVNPNTYNQTIYTDSGYDGIKTVTVRAVTASIDSDIKAENIKSGVNILGVEGTYELEPYVSESLSITPTTQDQSFTPGEGVDGFNKVDVSAVTAAIDPNITTKNIKRGVTILGVEGSYVTENLQSKTVNPLTTQQVVTFDDDKYEGLSSVTVNAVTSSIDSDIKAENIKSGVEILGVTGEYEGETYEIEPAVTATPQTTPVIVKPSEGYDYLSQVNIEGVTASIDPNILAENIKKNIQILGVTGTLEQQEYNFQDVKEVNPSLNDRTVTPDQGYDALMKVIVKAVTSSIDPNILPKNIRKNIQILGVTGTLEEGLPQKWYDFIDIKAFNGLSEYTLGGGSNGSLANVKIATTDDQILDPWYDSSNIKPIEEVSAAIFSIVRGGELDRFVDPTLYQSYVYINGGSYYYDYSTFAKFSPALYYLYPFTNDQHINGCLINYEDDGSEKQLNLYLIIDKDKVGRVVLVDGDMSQDLLPEGYIQYRYINTITIPAHDYVFTCKTDSNLDAHWVLKDEKATTNLVTVPADRPVYAGVSAYDMNHGEDETLTESIEMLTNYQTTSTPPTITDYIASGFSNNKYIIFSPNVDNINYLEVTCRVYVTGGGSYNVFFNSENKGFGVSGSTSYRYWRIWSGSANQSARYGYTNSRWYWCKLVQENGTTKLLTILDNDGVYANIDALPDKSDSAWTTSISINSAVFNSMQTVFIGNGYSTLTEYWRGQIDLNNFDFNINGTIYRPVENKIYQVTNHEIIPLNDHVYFYDANKQLGIIKGVVKPKHVGYDIVGSSVKVSSDGIASGATNSSHILTPVALPYEATEIVMIFNASTPTIGTSQGICYAEGNSTYTEAYVQSTNRFKCYGNGDAHGGVTPISSNINYWFAVVYRGGTWQGWLLVDNGEYTVDTLPEISSLNWINEWSYSSTNWGWLGYKVRFMDNSANQPWLGTFNLNKCAIFVDGVKYWCPIYNNSDSFELVDGSLYNYEDDGSAVDMPIWLASTTRGETTVTEGTNTGTIDDNGVFTATSTQTLYKAIENNLTNVEIYIKLRTPATTVTGGQRVITFGHVSSGELCPLYCALSDAGTIMYIKFGSESTYMNVIPSVANDTEYYVKITYDGTTAKTYYSLTGYDNMTQVASLDFTWSVDANTIMYLTGSTESNSKGKFVGSIYLQETYIKSNNDYIWRPYYILPSVEKKYIFAPESFTTETVSCIEQVGVAKIPYHSVFNWVDDHYEVSKTVTINVDDEDVTLYIEVE